MFLYVMIILINLITVAPQNISNNNKIYFAKNCIAAPDLFIRIELRNFNVVKILSIINTQSGLTKVHICQEHWQL